MKIEVLHQGQSHYRRSHVARFYGVCLAKMLMRYRSINQIFSTRGIFDAVPSVQASMTKNALQDLTTSLHYSDDWEVMGDDDWEDTYDDPKDEADVSTAAHRLKHGLLEDTYTTTDGKLLWSLGSGL